MEELNATLQDAKTLLKTARKYEAATNAEGIHNTLAGDLAGAIERATAADVSQSVALKETARLTAVQDRALVKATDLVRKLRYAAKSLFGSRDKQAISEFRIGKAAPKTVKEMAAELAYMKVPAAKYIGELARHGFKASDLAALDTITAELEQSDASQEMAKKAQKNATQARNDEFKALKQAITSVRNAARSSFLGRKDVLNEFESIKRAKGKRKTAEATTA